MPEIGTYVLPVIAAFEGIDAQVNKTLGQKFGVAGKKASKDFSKALGDGLQVDLEKAASSYKKLQDKAEDALGKIRAEEAKLQTLRDKGASQDRIVAAEERLATARRNSSRATADAQAGLRDFERAQSSATDTVQRAGSIFEGAGAKVGALGVAAGAAAVGGIALLAAGAIKAGRELYDLGAQFDDLSDTLQVKTGLSGAALDKLQQSVERLGTTNVPSTFAEIGDVAVEVTRNLHLTGPELESVTSRLANLARMGQTVDVRSLGKAFRAFGVDAKDQAPALNSLYEASTRSGLSIDDMLASVVKGGPALRQFGLSFGESAALITSFDEAGLDGEKGMAALTKAFAYFSKENIPAQQGLKDTIAEIQRLGDTPEAAALANKVFGAKGGVQFFEAIRNGTLDIQSLSDSLQTTGLDINDVSQNTADWSEKWQTLKNDVAVALEPLASGTFNAVNGELDHLSTWVMEHQDQVIDFFVTLGDGIITFSEVSVRSIGLFSEGLGQMVAPLGDVLGGLTDFNAEVQRLLGRDDIADQLEKDAQGYYSMGEGLTAFGRSVKDVDFNGLRDILHQVGDAAKDGNDKFGWWATGTKEVGDSADTTRGQVDQLKQSMVDLSNLPKPFVGAPVPPGMTGGPGTQPGTLPGMTGLPDLAPLTPGGGGSGALMNLQLAEQGFGAGAPTGGDKKSIADYIVQKAMAQGYSQQEALAFVAQAIGESQLSQGAFGASTGDSSGGASGIFQFTPGTWASFGQGDPLDAKANIDAYFRLAAARDPGSGDIRSRIGAISVGGPAVPSNSAPWDSYLSQASGLVGGSTATTPVASVGGAPSEEQVKQIAAQFGLQVTSEDRPGDPGYHGKGMALDVSNGSGNTAQMQAFAEYMTQNFGPVLKELIYSAPGFSGLIGDGKNVTGTSYYSADTLADHQNHVHVAANWGNSAAPGMSPDMSPLNSTMSLGYGTVGYNEDGEPGSYVPDPKKIREATERKKDADDRIIAADAAVAQAEARRSELKADAEESQKMAADEAVRQAKVNADKARREADDVAADLNETLKGDFKPAKKPKSGSGGKNGGLGQFGELGSIAGSFFKETFGFDGSFLPDLSSLGVVQMGGNLLNAFAGPLQGLVDGQLGIQQPGWVPGMPVNGVEAPSLSPFGMSSTQLPPIPTDGTHPGTGAAPGPVQIDNSTTINSPTGDPNDIENRIRRTNMNRPRIDSYAMPGT